MSGVVIIGAGQAGLQAAASLREMGWKGSIAMLGEEPELPYQRPPLSKAFLKGKAGEDTLLLKPQAFFEKHQVDLRTRVRAVRIDRAGHTVHCQDGSTLAYDHLILATGARNRLLPIEGATLAGVHYLRDWAEARALKEVLGSVRSVAVIGAGFIGLEFASVAREQGKAVTVLDVAPRVMGRAVSPIVSAHFEGLHRAAGIDLRLAVTPRRLIGAGGKVTGVDLAEGSTVSADIVVVGIGVVPNAEIAAEAGLSVQNGIRVDEALLTSDPAISAIGDCAAFPDVIDQSLVRLESVQNAVDQAKCVAARLARTAHPYRASPWFWSDQGETRLQMAGTAPRSDLDVVRGDPATGSFSVFRFLDGRLRVVESVNAQHDHLAARRLVANPASLTPEEAADTRVDLKAKALGKAR